MLNELITKKVWKKPEEGKHTAVLCNWGVASYKATETREAGEYLECEFLLDDKREIKKNLFEQDVRILASALVSKYFEEGLSLVELLNRWVSEKTKVDLWIKYNTANEVEYTNFYWFEPAENILAEELNSLLAENNTTEETADLPL